MGLSLTHSLRIVTHSRTKPLQILSLQTTLLLRTKLELLGRLVTSSQTHSAMVNLCFNRIISVILLTTEETDHQRFRIQITTIHSLNKILLLLDKQTYRIPVSTQVATTTTALILDKGIRRIHSWVAEVTIVRFKEAIPKIKWGEAMLFR